MLKFLMLLGYTEYQAQCVAPWLWGFVLAGVVAGIAGLAVAVMEDDQDPA